MKAGARARLPLGTVLGAALALTAATPPAWFPGAPALLVVGLALWFCLATGDRWPLGSCYLVGVLHVGAFSWSLRHVVVLGWAAIALVGGLYYLAAGAMTRKLPARWWTPGFALAVAGASWLRAEMPQIPYPHGQPCHALWQWPALLGAVRLGGEPLANGLLAAVAAAAAQLARGWRLGAPPFPRARRQLLAVSAAAAVLTGLGTCVARGAAARAAQGAERVAIAALEPGLHPVDAYAGVPNSQVFARWRTLLQQRQLAPTLAIAGPDAPAPPDLVLWPESSLPLHDVEFDQDGRPSFTALAGLDLHAGVRLCVGAGSQRQPERPDTPAAVLVDARGRYLGHQEKRRLVPGGEFLPFVDLLPASWAEAIEDGLRAAVHFEALQPGAPMPPLQTAAGVKFSALICYDNAFPGVVAGEVAAGARFLVVLSNEAWYRGGGELDQLAAITVVRAIESAAPIVRCTTDGLSLAVDASGRILAELPRAPAPTDAARILRVALAPGEGALPALAWLHPWLGWLGAAALLAGLLHASVPWARLPRLGRTPAGGAGGGPRPDLPAGGS